MVRRPLCLVKMVFFRIYEYAIQKRFEINFFLKQAVLRNKLKKRKKIRLGSDNEENTLKMKQDLITSLTSKPSFPATSSLI